MEKKLKGCRAVEVVQQEYTQTCASFGAAQYRAITLTKEIERIKVRLDELALELNSSAEQEAKIEKSVTNLQIVGDEAAAVEAVQ